MHQTSKPIVLFIDSVHPILEKELSTSGFDCKDVTTLSRTQLLDILHSATGIVIRSRTKINQEFINASTQLKFIARSGAGLENIDLEHCDRNNITVYNSPEGNMDAVGEHAIGMLLMLFNQLKKGDNEVREGIWDREGNRGLELQGKTVGILGYGNMGSALAKKLIGFECKVIAYDKYKTNYSDKYVKEVQLNDLFQQTDILSIHLPLTKETNYLVDNHFIKSFEKNIFLINTARGNNVKTDDLVVHLQKGKVLGACLDVLEYEKSSFEKLEFSQLPESFQYLSQSSNVILSPHVAGWTVESYYKLSKYLAQKILADKELYL